jgi:hypothetical protein
MIKRYLGDVVIRTRRRHGRIELRVARHSDGQRCWLSVTEEEYRSGLTVECFPSSTDKSDNASVGSD